MPINKLKLIRISGFTLLLILQLTFCCSVQFYAQAPDFRFNNIFKEDGLPTNAVNCVTKDKFGFLWITTANGLCRYDAKGRMKVFQADEENGGLHSNSLEYLYSDSKGFLWIGTRHGGITKIDLDNDIWTTYRHNPNDDNSLAHDEILCITEDTAGKIWIGTENGLSILYTEEERFVNFRVDPKDTSALQGKAVLSLMQDKKGLMWVGTWGGGLHLFLPNQKNIAESTFRNFMIPGENNHKVIWEVYQDKQGRYWLGEKQGLTYMQVPTEASDDTAQQNWDINFHIYQSEVGVPNSSIYSILEDSRGNLWYSSFQGLNLIYRDLLPDTRKFLHPTAEKPKLSVQGFVTDKTQIYSIPSNYTFHIYEDDQKLIWVSTGNGLSQFNWRTRQFEFLKIPEHSRTIKSIATHAGIVFSIADQPYIYFYDTKQDTIKKIRPKQSRINRGILHGFKYNEDSTLCMHGNSGIAVYDIENDTYLHEFIFENYSEYFPDWGSTAFKYTFHEGKFWIRSKGLVVFDIQSNQIKNYQHNPKDSTSLINNAISNFQFDNEGNLWIATWNGISVISEEQINQPNLPDTFTFKNYNAVNAGKNFISNKIPTLKNTPKYMYIGTSIGLISYEYNTGTFRDRTNKENRFIISSINDWTQNEIWMSTGEGIVNYNAETQIYKKYHYKYGLDKILALGSVSYKDEEGGLYFTGPNDIVRLTPDNFLENDTPPPVFVTNAEILNKEGETSTKLIDVEELTLHHGDYRIAFSFAALNYDSPEKNRYAYQLEGLDEGWRHTQSTEPVVYTNLKAGNYAFKAKAANNDGVWNEGGAVLKIVKKPAFWETNTFRIAMILLTILGVLWGVRAYNRRLVNRYKQVEAYNKKLNNEISERKRAEESLQEKNDELISINHDLEQFAYICSHDLKEPIRGVYSFTNLIEKEIQDEVTQKKTTPYFKFVYNYLKTQQNIISALGTFTAINKKQAILPVPVHVNNIYERVESNLKELIENKNVVVNLIDSTDSHIIYGSEHELSLVIEHLVRNGIKYNISEVPEVSVNLTKEEKDWLFTVKDNGVGVEEKYHEYIFKPFKTLENKNKTNSSGLGLAICAKIIARLGGKIWMESKPNEGSTFYVLLENQTQNEGDSEKDANLSKIVAT